MIMSAIFFKYYIDITRYNLLLCILVLILTRNIYAAVIAFGSFGMLMAIFVYRYYQNIEYYFYLNAGLSKRGIIMLAFKINLLISILISLAIWIIH